MFTEIGTAIKQAATIVILRHQNPDPDAIGSQTGLATLIREAYPDKQVYTPGVTQAGLTWIGDMTPITDDVYATALVIVVDTANTPRLDASPAYRQAKQVIKIDHHPDVDHFGDTVWVDDQSASCAEMIYKLTLHIPELVLSQKSAAALYAGIVGDTNRFLYDSTTADTLATATALAKTGINVSAISHHDYEITPQTARLEAYILTNFKLTETGLGYVILDLATLRQFDLKKGDLDDVVPLIGQISTVRDWVVISEQADGRYRVNFRSKAVSIEPIARKYGGGGHPLASGAYVKDRAMVDALLADLDHLNQHS